MRIISVNTLHRLGGPHPDAQAALNLWIKRVRQADWRMMSDVRSDFSKAKVIGADRVRFEIAGGDFRLVAAINFDAGLVYIKFFGTHAEYDRVDVRTVEIKR